MQTELNFSIHKHENNSESEAILKQNQNRLSNQCQIVYEAMIRGERLTTAGALINYGIGDLRRRVKDLIDYGNIPVQSVLLESRFKEYFLTPDYINQKIIL